MISEIQQLQLYDPLSCLDTSNNIIAVGTLEDNVYLIQQENVKLSNHLLGVIDIHINRNETQIAVSSFDNCLRIWDIDDRKLVSEIQCEAFANWKVRFYDSQTIITAGEQGILSFYHIETKERVQKLDSDPIYYICSLQINEGVVAAGNEGGSLFILDYEGTKKQLKTHFKAIKSLQFLESNRILTGSEDGLIKLIDLEKFEIIQQFRGHKYGVNDICKVDEKKETFISCSSDRSIRVWDISQIYSQRTTQANNDKPGGINGVRYHQNQIVAAHDCGLYFYSYII